MPNYKGHLFGGFIVFLVAIMLLSFRFYFSLITCFEWLLFTLLGSLFPDIDTKSKGQKLFYRFFFVLLIVLLVQQKLQMAVFVSLLSFIPLLVNHRGLCHNLIFVLSIPLLFTLYVFLFFPHYSMIIFGDALFFTLGAISHLWLDRGLRRMLRA